MDYKSAADFELPGSVDLTGNLPGSTPDTDNNELDEKQKSTDGTVKIHNKETKKKQGESRAKIHDKKPLDSESITVFTAAPIELTEIGIKSRMLADHGVEAQSSKPCRAKGFPGAQREAFARFGN